MRVEPVDVQLLSPEETLAILDLIRRKAEDLPSLGVELHGHFDVVCREEDGVVAWERHQDNLLTDLGRRRWLYDNINNPAIFTCGVAETPNSGRYFLGDNSQSTQVSTALAPTVDQNALTKTWSYTFAVPSQNRPIGIIGLCDSSNSNQNSGAYTILCYSLLVPMKTQSTSQTLEVSYRLTMTAAI